MDDLVYRSMLAQNHRLRVQLMLERMGISTINMSLQALRYINDGFKVGLLPDQIGNGLAVLMPIWEKENVEQAQRTGLVQHRRAKIHKQFG